MLEYGDKKIEISSGSKILSPKDQKLLLDGKFVVETGIEYTADDKIRKAYYAGVIFEIFEANYEEFSKMEIYTMILIAYPIFMKARQLQNVLSFYYELKSERDVFDPVG